MNSNVASSDGQRATILVVDDTVQNIDVLTGMLDSCYKVKAAINGLRALEIARTAPAPDLILLDIMMPNIDGLEVCRRLKTDTRTRNIPVIFITAMNEAEDEARGFEAGAVDYITKPFRALTVLARVSTHLALANQNKELERQVRERTAELRETRIDVIRCLGKAAEFKDDNTGLHVVRMSHYARILALEVGMTETEADLIFDAAPMHDVGKIGIPDSILKKPGKLNTDEWLVMQKHVEIGADILSGRPSELLDMARTMALTHHERWDGSGYPKGLAGEDIPLPGRILALADVFDALCSARSYKRAWPVEDAIRKIRLGSGTHFDPRLVDLLDKVRDQFNAVRMQYQEL